MRNAAGARRQAGAEPDELAAVGGPSSARAGSAETMTSSASRRSFAGRSSAIHAVGAGVLQPRPPIAAVDPTRQVRQDPAGASRSSEHRVGTSTPAARTASSSVAPGGDLDRAAVDAEPHVAIPPSS